MKLKKIASLMLAGVMAASMLAGCQSNTPTASGSGSQASTGAADGEVVHIKLFTGKIANNVHTVQDVIMKTLLRNMRFKLGLLMNMIRNLM